MRTRAEVIPGTYSAGDPIRVLRNALELTQRDLASLSGVSRYQIGRIERGQVPYDRQSHTWRALTDTLGTYLSRLNRQTFAEGFHHGQCYQANGVVPPRIGADEVTQ